MYLNYPLHTHWDLWIISSLKENIKRAVYRVKLIHLLTKNLCKNDNSKMEPVQSRGYVSFVRSKIDHKDI